MLKSIDWICEKTKDHKGCADCNQIIDCDCSGNQYEMCYHEYLDVKNDAEFKKELVTAIAQHIKDEYGMVADPTTTEELITDLFGI